MGLLRRLRGASMLIRFGAITLLLTLAVGVVLSSVLSSAITERARQQAESTAIVAVRLGLMPQLTPEDLAHGFDARRLSAVEQSVDGAGSRLRAGGGRLADLDPVALNIFNRDRTVVYSGDHATIGTNSPSDELGAALAGKVVSGFASSADDSATSRAGARQAWWSSTSPTRRSPRP